MYDSGDYVSGSAKANNENNASKQSNDSSTLNSQQGENALKGLVDAPMNAFSGKRGPSKTVKNVYSEGFEAEASFERFSK